MKNLTVALIGAFLFCISGVAPANTGTPDELHMGDTLPRFDLIAPGTHRYLRYRETDGVARAIDVISMKVSVEEHDGVPQLHVVQNWDLAAPQEGGRELDSWFELETFRPSVHVRRSTRDGKLTVEGFRFGNDAITGLAGLAENTRADYNVASSEPAYNFETDLLLLQALPLAADYAARIVFHHPGGNPPAPYIFAVSGSETLIGPDGKALDCWLVTTDYNRPENPRTRFWVAKGTQQVVKVVAPITANDVVVKTLLW